MNSNFLKAIIIDDEQHCIDYLTRSLREHCPEVGEVTAHSSLLDGMKALMTSPPDVLFLDVEMPGGTGFDLLATLENPDFKIIFTTAHNKYAIEAVRTMASDYLLKPIQPEELRACMDRFIKSYRSTSKGPSRDDFRKIPLPTQQGMIFGNPSEIIRCEADGSYTKVYMNSRHLLISKNIKTLELLLEPYGFFRVHKSHLINLRHLSEYIKGSGGTAVMSDGSMVDVSKRKREDFLGALI